VQIYYSQIFLKNYKKLPNSVHLKFEKQEKIFRANPFDPRLKTHPLTGKLKSFYSYSIDYHHRVIFYFQKESEIWFENIGTHAIYK